MPRRSADEPHSPRQIEAQSWRLVVRRTFRAFGVDGCPDVAAALTFYAVLALVPAVVVSFSAVILLGRGDETAQLIIELVRTTMPGLSTAAVTDLIAQLSETRLSGIVLVLAVGLTVWAVARYVAALGRGMNQIYGVAEGRPLWQLKGGQLLLALVLILGAATVATVLTITGGVAEELGRFLGMGDTALLLWRIIRGPLLAVVVILLLALLYYCAPNVRPARFRWMSLGAGVALLVLLLASVAFGFYIARLADYGRLYGAFAGVVVFALWLWIANMAILVGAEFDAEVERVRQLQAGIPAEKQVQVPLRDARRIADAVRKDRAEEKRARDIRS